MARRLLIAGADGFIGQNMIPAALECGWTVTSLAHDAQKLAHIDSPHLTVVEWCIDNLAPVKDFLPEVDAVAHLAAFIPPDFRDPTYAELCFQINALGAQAMLQAALEAHVPRFIYYSSGNAYAPQNRLAKEDDPLYPARRAPYYLASKIAGEIFNEHYRLAHCLPTTTLRLSAVYGPGMRDNEVLPIFVRRAQSGQLLEINDGGRHRVDFVSVQDVIQATFKVIEAGADGIFNVGSGRQTSVLELAQVVVRVCGADPDLLHVHPPVGNYQAAFSGLDIVKAQTILDYHPLSLEDGVRHFVHSLHEDDSV